MIPDLLADLRSPRPFVRMDQLAHTRADQVVGSIAQHAVDRLADESEVSLDVDDGDGVSQVRDQGAKALETLWQQLALAIGSHTHLGMEGYAHMNACQYLLLMA